MSLFRHLRSLFRRHSVEAEMAEEMRYHLEQRAAEYAADGLAAEEARLAAQRRFGNAASIQEQAREAWGWGALERLGKDLAFAVRQLARSPGFSLLAIVTLGLGVGANTAMFNVVNGIVLKPVPYAGAAQLDRLYRATAQEAEANFSAADFLDLREAPDGYGQFAAYVPGDASLSEPGHPAEMTDAARATTNFLALLGVRPQLGRDFLPGEDEPGRDRVVILSQRTWRKRFDAKPEVIGRTIRIDGVPHQVVGVLPESFNDWRHLGWVDYFRPLALTPKQAADRHTPNLRVIGRRPAGLSLAEGAAYLAGFGERQAKAYPEANAGSAWRVKSLQHAVVGRSGPGSLAMLVGLSGFVLVIACSNLANLLLARTMARAREFAVRAALGASRLQLLRPLIAESLLLALAGGVVALLVAQWVGDWLAVRSTGDNGEQVVFALDWNVFGWALGASLATALVFGVAPALFALRLDVNQTLKSGGRTSTGGRGHQRFRQLLIVGQFALAMVLLSGAGLFIRGLDDLNHRRSGWVSEQLVSGSILLPAGGYAEDEKIRAFQRTVLERLAALPGVASASVSAFTPYFSWPDARKFLAEGRDRPEPGQEPAAQVNRVSPGYFDTVGTRVLAGRAFNDGDTATSARVYIISEATAHALWGNANPLGRRLAPADGENPAWGEVVGVVSDVLSSDPAPGAVNSQLYLPMTQEPARQCEIAVRAHGVASVALVDSVRTAMTALDPDLPVRRLQPADQAIVRANYQLGVLRDMLASFAVLGLALASLGVYGIIARTMAQRTGEFAVRLALGARVEDLTRIVLTSGVKLAFAGAMIGLVGASGVGKVLASGFPGIRMGSPWILAGVTVLLVTVALVASWLPARRAGKVDPISALRAE